jgi:hypothetical protein
MYPLVLRSSSTLPVVENDVILRLFPTTGTGVNFPSRAVTSQATDFLVSVALDAFGALHHCINQATFFATFYGE